MKYAHIMLAVASEFWAMDENKLVAVPDFVRMQAAGAKFTSDEISARIGAGQERDVARREGTVAILPLKGVIANRINLMSDISGGTSSEAFGKALQSVLRDDAVKAIVIDVDSPGGIVSGTDELSSMIHAARGTKPIVAHVNATAASAAYWIASAADEVVVTPSGWVGSIGIIGVHDDISKALDTNGIKRTLITAGRYKGEADPSQPLSDDAREAKLAEAESYYSDFVRAVARNRGKTLTAVREGFGQGRMVRAEPALAEGMIDRIATLDETLRRFGASLYGPSPKRRGAFATEREKRALAL
jgi:signal peptide peptidase SppA